MKRREFLLKSGGLLGAMIPAVGIGQTRPCSQAWSGRASSSSCAPGAPAWFTNLGHLEAVAPVTNWLGASGVKDPLADTANRGATGHRSIIDTWNGMGLDQDSRTAFMLHNGGHNDYYGNEVYSLDLASDAPAWIRRRDASVSDGSGNLTKFSDGRPCSDHTANLHVAAEGRWFTAGMGSTNQFGYGNRQQWWEYDLETEDYIDLGNSHQGGGFGYALWDPEARQILTIFDQHNSASIEFQSIDNMSGSPVLLNMNRLGATRAAAIDTTNRVLLAGAGNAWFFVRIDTNANRRAAWTPVNASGTPPADINTQIQWHAPSNAFITWDGGNEIRKLTPTAGYTSLSWSGVPVGGVSMPASGAQYGMFDKVNLINDMGNGDSAMVLVPRYENPDTYVIRLTGPI